MRASLSAGLRPSIPRNTSTMPAAPTVATLVWVLLATSVGQGYAFVSRPFRQRQPSSRNQPLSGGRSMRCSTAPLIEATACRVLKLVLRNGREAHVSCSVESEGLDLLQGRLRAASVKGRGWASRLGFTARTIAVDLGNASVDVGALFHRRAIEFRTPPPSGTAVVVFDAVDFGNFLAHKFVRRATLAGRDFMFQRGDVFVDPVTGLVEFGGRWGDECVRVGLSQGITGAPQRGLVAKVSRVGGRGAAAEGHSTAEGELDALASAMGEYFNTLDLDLDGPRLRFLSLSFEGTSARDGRVKLELSIVVPKLPSVRAVSSF